MPNTTFNKQRSPARRFLFILGGALFLSVTVFGLLIMFWNDIPLFNTLSQGQRYAFGSVFIVYGILRFIRIVRTPTLNDQ
jgi:hypothetical protein